MKQRFLRTALMLVLIFYSTAAWAEAEKEMYVRITGSTMTFYYDENMTEGDYRVENGGWDGSQNVTRVIFDSSFADARPTSTNLWFKDFENLQSIDGISNLNTSQVTSMVMMFFGCSSITTLDLSSFDTSNVTDMKMMFQNCLGLTNLNVSHFDTSKVTNMGHMFLYCSSLTSLDVSNFNTSNVTDMHGMFHGCSSLTSLDVRNFSTNKVTDMEGMFSVCSSLTSLDVSNFITGNVTRMNSMFDYCSSLTSLDLSNFNTSNVTEMGSMFEGNGSLCTINVGDKWSTAKVEQGDGMFRNCEKLVGSKGTAYSDVGNDDYGYAHIDGGESNPGYLSYPGYVKKEMYARLSGSTLTFYYDENMTDGDYLVNEDWTEGWRESASVITHVVFDSSFADARPKRTYYWFSDFENLQSIEGISNLNTSKVTDMEGMFNKCSSLTGLDVSSFNTSNVTNMRNLFQFCRGLTNLNVSNFDTSNVTDMLSMFFGCGSLTSLDLSNFNTSNVTQMSIMFGNCSSLCTINVGDEWSTAKVEEGGSMFSGCKKLVGSKGTAYSDVGIGDYGYAHIDGGESNPGYLSYPGYVKKEMYARLSGSTLTFYYDENMTDGDYLVNEDWTEGWRESASVITHVVFDSSFADARPKRTYYWFSDFENLQSIEGISNLNTSKVTDMQVMFRGCSSLTSLDVSNFNTSNVTDMQGMFGGCSSLTSLDVSNFDTSNVPNMSYMFDGCSSLTSLDVSNFNTANVTDMEGMFRGCSSLTSLDVSNFDTSNLPNMSFMFDGCSSLTSLDVSNFNTSNVTLMSGMFSGCSSLTSLDVSNFDTSNVTLMSGMFSECSSLTGLDVSNFNTSNVTLMRTMFSECRSLTSLDVSNFDTSNVTDMGYMFNGCSSLTSLDVSNFNTSKVTDMRDMFEGCSSLTSLDVSNFITGNVTRMNGMFNGCSSLTSLNISNFSTANVTDMGWMFRKCSSLTNLDISHFNTSKVTDMGGMFEGCSSLTSLDVSNFDTSNGTGMRTMFGGCNSLTSLDISNFNTSKVTDMGGMFNGCSSLTSLDLSNFDTSNVTDMEIMFMRCSSLITIYVSDKWSTAKVTNGNGMFGYNEADGCKKLVGCRGTTFSVSHTGYDYAHIDGGESNPGYLSVIPVALIAEDVTIDNAELTYTGSAQLPVVSVAHDGKQLTADYDYTLTLQQKQADESYTDVESAINASTYKLIVTGIGEYAGAIDKAFVINPATATISFAEATVNKTYGDANFTNELTNNGDGTVKYASNQISVATVDETTGEVSIAGAGTATITATVTDGTNYTYPNKTATLELKVAGKADASFTITLDPESYTYDGTAKEPTATVKEGEKTLTAETDYTIAYSDNVNAGTAKVTVNGVGNYEGSSAEKEFTITAKALTDGMVTLSAESFDFNGELHKPTVTVKDGEKTLLEGTDYELTNEGGNAPGTYSVKVEGKGNYGGEVTKNYVIVAEIVEDADVKGAVIDDEKKEVVLTEVAVAPGTTSAIIPSTIGEYTVVAIVAGAFAGRTDVTDIYLPETDEPVEIGANALKIDDTHVATVHTPLSLLDDYALNTQLKQNFEAGKVTAVITAPNKYWTFSCGVDVLVPDGVGVYTCQLNSSKTAIEITQIDDLQLTVGDKKVIKANNGVLVACIDGTGGNAYSIVANSGGQESGTTPATTDAKSYGLDNQLEPVIEAANYASGNYYVLKDNEFHPIIDNSSKVPACKAVLKLSLTVAGTRGFIIEEDDTTGISGVSMEDGKSEWFNLNGQRIERPTTKGLYINNGKKVIIK